MKKKKSTIVLLIFVFGGLLFLIRTTHAKKMKTSGHLMGNSRRTDRQYGVNYNRTIHAVKSRKTHSEPNKRRNIVDNSQVSIQQKLTNKNLFPDKNTQADGRPGGRYAAGVQGPPWFMNTDDFPGGPSWLQNEEQGASPWFWQAYNGHDVSGSAPVWFIDPLTTAPAWLYKKSGGPWWSYYLFDHENE